MRQPALSPPDTDRRAVMLRELRARQCQVVGMVTVVSWRTCRTCSRRFKEQSSADWSLSYLDSLASTANRALATLAPARAGTGGAGGEHARSNELRRRCSRQRDGQIQPHARRQAGWVVPCAEWMGTSGDDGDLGRAEKQCTRSHSTPEGRGIADSGHGLPAPRRFGVPVALVLTAYLRQLPVLSNAIAGCPPSRTTASGQPQRLGHRLLGNDAHRSVAAITRVCAGKWCPL